MQGGADESEQAPASDAMPLSSLSTIASAAPVGLTLRDEAVPANSLGLLASNLAVQDRIALSDARLRSWGAIAIVASFVIANGIVLAGVWLMFNQEMAASQNKVYAASDRIITSPLLITLVGATTVQLGALTILMGKYLFPAPRQ